MLDKFTINNIKSDSLQFGLALTLSHIFAGKNFIKDNYFHIKSIFLTIIGFATFHLLISKLFNIKNLNPHTRITVEDILKFSTMLIVSKFFINRNRLKNKNFILSGINLIISFFIYDSIILKNYTYKLIKPHMNINQILAINDMAKFGFVLLFTEVLDSLSNKENINFEYIRLTVGYITGLVLYDLYLI